MIDEATRERGLRAYWYSRPLTLRIYVGASLAATLFFLAYDPRQRAYPWILVTFFSLLLLKMLWDGSSGVWWLTVIFHGAAVALSLAAAFRGASVWIDFALSATALMLLVHGSTRRWFNQRIAERFP